MAQWAYLLALCASLTGLAVIDYRYKLAFWFDYVRTVKVLAISIGVFVIWDIVGILLGIFFHGGSRYTLSFRLLPEFPIEELFFLLLLTYTTLVSYRFGVSKWPRT